MRRVLVGLAAALALLCGVQSASAVTTFTSCTVSPSSVAGGGQFTVAYSMGPNGTHNGSTFLHVAYSDGSILDNGTPMVVTQTGTHSYQFSASAVTSIPTVGPAPPGPAAVTVYLPHNWEADCAFTVT